MLHQRTVKTHIMRLTGNAEAVFPLLCPVREYEWIDTWQCEMIHSESGVAEQDCIFRTTFPGDGPPDTWVVSRYERPRLIEFVRVNAIRAMRYTIRLEDMGEGSTEALWRQVITGLNEEGDALVAQISEDAFHGRMEVLERMLNHFLKTGRMLRLQDARSGG